MATNILMPALSPTMEKGNLAKWLKKEGDKVKAGDVLAEIETDKATMEYEAVDEGTLAKIVVPEGTQDVAVNAVIAVLAAEGEDVKAAASAAKSAPAAKAPEAPKPQKVAQAEPPKDTAAAQPAVPPKPAAQPAPQAAPSQRTDGANRIFSSPLARRLARDAGVDLNRVQGSGPHGRVIARDIAEAKSGKGLRAAPSAAGAIAPAMS
ncbi:MAG TPA: biotin/lipoyl-containing protein, partial [Pseudolabrys sp.]|nr:biotin/lipoyl-containing protein [Pseudolabrys sp.]